ncbi:MAG: 23S rRNA (uracil(1939)-C(5))-methyltransferase RlmD [Bacillota bacterium]|nr:23S rRNA (uracil(1939)-C(5))-methyltransferase RlmD [Bacillota bacterium]
MLQISDLNHDGKGVGKHEGFTFFIGGALPGERVEVSVTRVRKSYAEAELLAIIDPSPARVQPPCPYYSRCGGCSLQHFTYDEQLKWKQRRVYESLRRIAGVEAEVLFPLGMADPWQYRNKARIHFQDFRDGKGKQCFKAGFYEARSHRIIEIENCLIQHPLNVKMINAIRRALENALCDARNRGLSCPLVDAVTIRTAVAEDSCLVMLEGKESGIKKKVELEELASLIDGEVEKPAAGILWRQMDSSSGGDLFLRGRKYLTEKIASYHYRLSPVSFFQVNPLQAKRLYETALAMIGNRHICTAFDLYCGTGSFSLFLSSTAQKVIGVDSSTSAIEDAVMNARLNNIDNIKYIKARAEEIGDLLQQGKNPKTVCLNPPRNGCSPQLLESVSSANPEQIVYISCNPATLARDLKLLIGKDFAIRRVQPVDMFPHTTHVETVVLMSRISGDK